MSYDIARIFELHPRWERKITVAQVQDRVPGNCWLWTGASSLGYGRITVNKKALILHRYVYELLAAPIPAGLHIDHLCRQPACCNPAHLEPVTPKVNSERGLRGELLTRCPSGHEYSGENLRLWTDSRGYTRRNCRTCAKEHAQRWREERNLRRKATWALYLGEAAS